MKTMTRKASILVAATGLLLASLPAAALPLPTTTPGPHAAQINGIASSLANDLYDVRFIGINGQNIPARSVMWLQPGRYEITVMIVARGTRRSMMRRTLDEPGYNTIELVVEAGKTYDIRAKFDRTNARSPYSVVLHRVTE